MVKFANHLYQSFQSDSQLLRCGTKLPLPILIAHSSQSFDELMIVHLHVIVHVHLIDDQYNT